MTRALFRNPYTQGVKNLYTFRKKKTLVGGSVLLTLSFLRKGGYNAERDHWKRKAFERRKELCLGGGTRSILHETNFAGEGGIEEKEIISKETLTLRKNCQEKRGLRFPKRLRRSFYEALLPHGRE